MKLIDHDSRKDLLDVDDRSKNTISPNEIFNFCFINFLLSHTIEAADPPQPHFGPLDPRVRVKSMSGRLKPDRVDYWEGALQHLFYKLCLKMIAHTSRSTRGLGSSRSRFWVQRCFRPLLNNGSSITFVLYSFCQVVLRLRLQSHPDPILAPSDSVSRVRSKARRLWPEQINYWEDALQRLCYKLFLKMIDHNSRRTRGPGSSGAR